MKGIRVTGGGAMVMDHATFRKLDYVELCAHFGLRPSKPWHNADGKYVGPRRKRKRKKTAASHRVGKTD